MNIPRSTSASSGKVQTSNESQLNLDLCNLEIELPVKENELKLKIPQAKIQQQPVENCAVTARDHVKKEEETEENSSDREDSVHQPRASSTPRMMFDPFEESYSYDISEYEKYKCQLQEFYFAK
jgi:hypothetical protein